MTDLPELPLVEVLWFDSCSHHGWRDQADFEAPGLSECRSVGYLVETTPIVVRLAQSQAQPGPNEQHLSEVISIPAQCVREVRHLVPRG